MENDMEFSIEALKFQSMGSLESVQDLLMPDEDEMKFDGYGDGIAIADADAEESEEYLRNFNAVGNHLHELKGKMFKNIYLDYRSVGVENYIKNQMDIVKKSQESFNKQCEMSIERLKSFDIDDQWLANQTNGLTITGGKKVSDPDLKQFDKDKREKITKFLRKTIRGQWSGGLLQNYSGGKLNKNKLHIKEMKKDITITGILDFGPGGSAWKAIENVSKGWKHIGIPFMSVKEGGYIMYGSPSVAKMEDKRGLAQFGALMAGLIGGGLVGASTSLALLNLGAIGAASSTVFYSPDGRTTYPVAANVKRLLKLIY